ncbi:hypothetical protein M408DRAFT_164124 [Serendipita vermifera MAFF 305830]|uniref:Dynamin N-terminal domain-containing protein n=1 Tax=Serendipita vermifera MAFF 305830 TaxID=933852 RepID=A0A0C2XF37_SERVB|nr:hypothetical protein M408DRAFT_164124 [Serendipita vermifera MAFF 305830]
MEDLPKRRASLQEDTNDRALEYMFSQMSMSETIADLKTVHPGSFTNNEIRLAALELQDVIISIEKELVKASKLLKQVQTTNLHAISLGPADTRTSTMIRTLNDAVAKGTADLKTIHYMSAIPPAYITSLVVPDHVLTSLKSDTGKGHEILTQFSQIVSRSQQEWNEIESTNSVPESRTASPQDANIQLAREWHQKHPKLNPYLLKDLPQEYNDLYNSALIASSALLPLPPFSNGDQNGPKCDIQALIGYEKDLGCHSQPLDPLPEIEDVYNLELPDNVLIRGRDVKETFQLFQELRNNPLRICVFGLFNGGKSSFINALIGKQVLYSDNGLATAWPIVVCHDKHALHPELEIPPGALKPFLDLLGKYKFSELRDPEKKHDIAKFRDQYDWVTSASNKEIQYLKIFEDPPKDFLANVKSTSDNPSAVMNKVNEINRLVRFCWQLCPTGGDTPITSNMWPKIKVEFQFFSGQDLQIELLDCPGSGEDPGVTTNPVSHKGMPDFIMETSLKGCLDGSFCVVKPPSHNTSIWKQMIASARKWTDRRPLAVYLTHMDDSGELDEQVEVKGKVLRRVYPQMTDDLNRLHFCAPGVFVGACHIMQRIGLDPFAKARNRPSEDFNTIFEEDWPKETPKFSQMVDKGLNSALLKILWGADNVRSAENKYNKKGYKGLKADLSDVWENYNFLPAVDHFRIYAVEDGYNRRQFRQLCLMRTALGDLLRAQRDLVDFITSRERDFAGQQSNYDKFEHIAQIQWQQWKITSWSRAMNAAVAVQKNQLEETKIRAKQAIGKAVKDAIESMDLLTMDGVFSFKSPSEKAEFLSTIQCKLSQEVEQLHKLHVEAIRENARSEWSALMHSLASEIFKLQPEFTTYPRDEIVAVLKNAGDDMEMAVYRHLIGVAIKLSEAMSSWECQRTRVTKGPQVLATSPKEPAPIDIPPVNIARVSEVKDLMANENLPFRISCALVQNKEVEEQHLSAVERNVAHGLDIYGFMFRPCIPVSITAPAAFRNTIWDGACSREHDGPCSEDTCTFSVAALETELENGLVAPWLNMLEKESEKTLCGTVNSARDVARVAVKGFLAKRGSYLQKGDDYRPPAVPDNFLRKLITWNANCSVVFEAVDGLCSEWLKHMGRSLLPQSALSGDIIATMGEVSQRENEERSEKKFK